MNISTTDASGRTIKISIEEGRGGFSISLYRSGSLPHMGQRIKNIERWLKKHKCPKDIITVLKHRSSARRTAKSGSA